MRRLSLAAAALVLLAALAGCGLFRDKPSPRETGIIYSPNGEPLSGGPLDHPACADALDRWFDRVDRDHDGTIDLGEFLADAERQFAAMDLDKSGVLTPAELAQYRAPYLANTREREARNGGDSDDDADRRRRRGGDSNEPPIGVDRADPVMLADVGLHNEVTRDEFLAYARRNFAALDRDKTGKIDRAAIVATCKR